MNEELLEKEEVWLRITQLEYKMKDGMSKETFEEEVKRIYLEEMGEELPAEMRVYSSFESDNIQSDYDGTAISLKMKKKESIKHILFLRDRTTLAIGHIMHLDCFLVEISHKQKMLIPL